MIRSARAAMLVLAAVPPLSGCGVAASDTPAPAPGAKASAVASVSPCSGTWPSYWQDPAFQNVGMWRGQTISDTPAAQNWTPANPAYTNPAFRIADRFSAGRPDDPRAMTWRDRRFNALFDGSVAPTGKAALANDYAWALMRYIQEGNIDSGDVDTDWNACANTKRQWFNMPFQTYSPIQGREFIHGLTREAPVTLSVSLQSAPLGTTVWAVAFYNGNAAPTLASVWRDDGTVKMPTDNLAFAEGTVVGKLLFTTASADNMPMLRNLPQWTANISMGGSTASNPTFCTPAAGASMPAQSAACQRSPRKVTLLQFDVAVRDARAPNGWVLGTFVADGEARAGERNPWNRISPLGLIWGNDTPPTGQLASVFPAAPRTNGFRGGVIQWDVVDRINKSGGAIVSKQPGHLGCNSRLNGPADNVASSCTSCHMTASVPDKNNNTPPLLANFYSPTITPQCAILNATPAPKEVNGVSFADMDSIFFAETKCASPFETKVGGKCVLGPNMPSYASGRGDWISTDFSLQMTGALVQWNEWQADVAADRRVLAANKGRKMLGAAALPPRVFTSKLPIRNEN
ncbi:hypothetical protein ASE86_14535 [Sphingomonas sp. Leaf33]|uniref:hypothetical protein n=1 Tax=Sphingomonas sp. Leaf33 TaxID=1736215 RepID=UPI0006FFEB79|nr:hypothetical protein [Sphingomonas sp. Leaf33]KQN21439.1 hypothetical protein ASE86_14535 [Sphingomonas sp. Leaf33]